MTSATATAPRQDHGTSGRTVLVVDDDEMVVSLVSAGLQASGLQVLTAADGYEALAVLATVVPDAIVSDVNMPGLDGFGLVSRLRADSATRSVPLVFLTSRDSREDVLRGLELGADDYVRKPFDLEELVGRVQAKLRRPSVPVDALVRDARTGLLNEAQLTQELTREVARAQRANRPGAVALIDVAERDNLRRKFGPRSDEELAMQLAAILTAAVEPLDVVGRDEQGRFLLVMPESEADAVLPRLRSMAVGVTQSSFVVAGERVTLTPLVGWTTFEDVQHPRSHRAGGTPAATPPVGEELLRRCRTAADASSLHLDLQPVRWVPELDGIVAARHKRAKAPWRARLRTPIQIALTYVLGVVLPFGVYVGLAALGLDISSFMYLVVVVALLVTAASIWLEGFLALDPVRPPDEPGAPYPAASAIIAAYLPNEAATVMETVEAFLRQDYPGPLQIILAYNTPQPMAIEAHLQELARQDPRFLPLKVDQSTSKAQNVNAALAEVTGEFVGVFDADHQPDLGSFQRAWRWLSNGYDVVQGHCVVRNGDASFAARTIAVEFESIYAVSHPGRAQLHKFGIFGGSNGYWRTERLREIRMHGFMLTEDIDSSLRVVESGGRIANDPGLVSRELAPTTWGQLWNQRMRWAQGWFQVSKKHFPLAWRSPELSLRQKLGMSFLLGWREVYPWISLQMFPIVAFLALRAGGVAKLNWLISLFVLTSLFTTSVGPGQTLFAYRLAVPTIRRQRGWFWRYLLVSTLFYTEYKNIIARVSQIKEFTGEREWKVTPRTASAPATESANLPATASQAPETEA